jgi:hypothetical protein
MKMLDPIPLLVVTVLGALPAFYLWAYIHEFSHVFMAKRFGATNTKIDIYMPPKRMDDGTHRWARYQWTKTREVTDKERAALMLAPRIPNLPAIIAFPFFGLFPEWVAAFWFLLMGGGVVDFIAGSIGRSEYSDLRRAAGYLDMSVWPFRLAAAAFVICDIAGGLYFAGWLPWAAI